MRHPAAMRSATIRETRKSVVGRMLLMLMITAGLCLSVTTPGHGAQHYFYRDVIPAPDGVGFGLPRTVQGRNQCVSSCVTTTLRGRNVNVNLQAVLDIIAPDAAEQIVQKTLADGARVLGQFNINSNGYVVGVELPPGGAQPPGNVPPSRLQQLANQGRPTIFGVEGVSDGRPFQHAIVVEGTHNHNGQLYYVVNDSARGAPNGGRYLKPARTMELVTVHVLEPLVNDIHGNPVPGNPVFDPQRDAFRTWRAGEMGNPALRRMLGGAVGGAVSGGVSGAVSTFILCKVMANSTEVCFAAAGESVPKAAFLGAVAASCQLGALLAAAYGAGEGAVAIGEASIEFAGLVEAIIEESKRPTGDIEGLIRARLPQILAAETRSLADIQSQLQRLGTSLDAARQATVTLTQANGRFQVLHRRLDAARQNLEKVRSTCQVNDQRRRQLDQMFAALNAVQASQATLERAADNVCRAAPPQLSAVRAAQAAYADFKGGTTWVEQSTAGAIAIRRAMEYDDALIGTLLTQLHPVADVSEATQIRTDLRRMCQAPPPSVDEGRALVSGVAVSLDVVKTRADLLGKYLPTRSSDIRVQVLELRQNHLTPMQVAIQRLDQDWTETCNGAERQATDLAASANQLQQQAAYACLNRVGSPSEAELGRGLSDFVRVKQAGEQSWQRMNTCYGPTASRCNFGELTRWRNVLESGGSSTWEIMPNGQAQEYGMGGASGTATMTDSRIDITWTTPNGAYAGSYNIVLNQSCSGGEGTMTWTKAPGNPAKRTFKANFFRN